MNKQSVTGILLFCSICTSLVVAEELKLNLKCDGEGLYTVTETSDTTNNKKKGTDTTIATKQQTTRGPVRFLLNGYTAKVKLPPVMLPLLMSNEDERGWLQVKDLNVNDTTIRGEIDLGTFTSADLVIDRQTGDISIDGGYTRKYNGNCVRESLSEYGTKF